MAEVVTGEAVVLDLAVARFPSRILALLLDLLVQFPLIFVWDVVVDKAAQHLNTASVDAIKLIGIVLIVISYPTIFETLTRGKSLGKMALGIRVVGDDGGPVRFRQALIRALSGAFVEIWPPVSVIGGPAGLVTSMVSAKGKRLGDMFAGTFVIQERVPRRAELAPAFMVVPPPLLGWAEHLELSRLSDQTAAAASSYLRRFYDLREPAREQLGLHLASTVAAQVSPPPPPGTPPAAYLAAVLAVRRQRELARLAFQPNAPAPSAYASAAGAHAPAAPAPQAYAPVPTAHAPAVGAHALPATLTATEPTPAPLPEPGQAPAGTDEPAPATTPGPATSPEDYGFAAPR